jgi:uncharacterized damage-inducible protein DinB
MLDALALKEDLHRKLRQVREGIFWKQEGLSEFDVRRPLTPTGTNLLGLVKHLAVGQASYFGRVFDRPFPDPLPWWEDGAEPNGDMYATAEESRDWVLDFYRRACDHADETIAALDLDAVGEVPWWDADRRQVTLHQILVHSASEGHRHLGHADILREELDGSVGVRPEVSNLPDGDLGWWNSYHARLQQIADGFR